MKVRIYREKGVDLEMFSHILVVMIGAIMAVGMCLGMLPRRGMVEQPNKPLLDLEDTTNLPHKALKEEVDMAMLELLKAVMELNAIASHLPKVALQVTEQDTPNLVTRETVVTMDTGLNSHRLVMGQLTQVI